MIFQLLALILEDVASRRGTNLDQLLDQLPVGIESIILYGTIACFACFPVYMVSFYMFLRRLWKEIPSEFARTTPGKAAGFMFIPFWNVYWMFVAFGGLYKDMNRTTESLGLGSRFDESRILKVCGTWVLLLIGFVCLIVLEAILGDGRLIFVLNVLLSLGYLAVTIQAYYFIAEDVLKFINIKASGGELENARAAGRSPSVSPNQHVQGQELTSAEKIKNPFKPAIIAGGFFIALFLLLSLVGNVWQRNTVPPPLTPAEQAEVDVILTLYGRAALVNYLHYVERARRDVQGGGGLFGGDRRAFNINLRNKDPNLVLKYVKNFIDLGVDVNAVSESGWVSLDYAVRTGDARIVNHLIFNEAVVGGLTFFRLAREGNVDMLRNFVTPFVVYDLEGARDHNGDTLLHVASNVEVARFLVDNGADVNATNNADATPLHSAASGGRLEVVQYLISQEARVDVRNRRGQTPLDLARANNRAAVVAYLSGIR